MLYKLTFRDIEKKRQDFVNHFSLNHIRNKKYSIFIVLSQSSFSHPTANLIENHRRQFQFVLAPDHRASMKAAPSNWAVPHSPAHVLQRRH